MRGSPVWVGRLVVAAMTVGLVISPDDGYAEEPNTEIPDAVVTAFKKANRNGDQKLSLDEFLVGREAAEVAKRDFKLFDFDADGGLSLEEFACVGRTVSPDQPGVVPDYLPKFVDQSVAALDKAFGDWDQHPEREVNAAQFIASFVQDLGNNALRANMREADPNQDQKVSRAEARRFIEIQLGVRRRDGKLLRFPNGNVINYAVYLHADANRNDVLDRQEYLERSYAGDKAAEEFTKLNLDGDEVISFDEFCRLPWRGVSDPVVEFQNLDINLDARVDPKELLEKAPDWQRRLAEHTFPGFDLDQDGVLSLAEYLLTPIANKVLPWAAVLGDPDADDFLSLAEFQFDQMQFPLLRLLCFQRLDVNGDKRLSPSEYYFKTKVPLEFFLMNEDGGDWKFFFKFDGRPNVGSPSVSPDGKALAFDSHLRNDLSTNTVYVMDLVERKPREICVGMMPTWSADGKRLACSRNAPQYGIWTIGVDGQDAQHIRPGWGAQWSPDGKRIAFYERLEVKAYNVESGTVDVLLPANENPYRQVYWNMTWSPDSKQICVKGLKPDATQELAILDPAATPKLKTRVSNKQHILEDSTWHPRGERVVFAMHCPERNRIQMYEFNPQSDEPPTLVKGQDPGRSNGSACWTPDGKRLIVVSIPD